LDKISLEIELSAPDPSGKDGPAPVSTTYTLIPPIQNNENEQIKLYYIDGKENLADILTKNLGQILFSCFCLSLGLKIL